MKRFLYAGLMATLISLLVATVSPAVAQTQSLAAYFPSAAQYPAGFDILSIHTYRQPASVFGDANARMARQLHFVIGNTQVAFAHGLTVTVAVARFGSVADAGGFRARVKLDIVNDWSKRTRRIGGLGSSGALYVEGNCASCGAQAPPLGDMLFTRGPILVLVGVQAAVPTVALQVSKAIDTKLKRAHVG
jgi:hypothetical protein